MIKVRLNLHRADHSCDDIGCDFTPAYHAYDAELGREISFAVGTVGDKKVVIVARGHLREATFRKLTLFELGVVSIMPTVLRHENNGTPLEYRIEQIAGQTSVPELTNENVRHFNILSDPRF